MSADSLSLSDAVTRILSLIARQPADVLSVSDAVVRAAISRQRQAGDGVSIADFSGAARGLQRTVSDVVVISDSSAGVIVVITFINLDGPLYLKVNEAVKSLVVDADARVLSLDPKIKTVTVDDDRQKGLVLDSDQRSMVLDARVASLLVDSDTRTLQVNDVPKELTVDA